MGKKAGQSMRRTGQADMGKIAVMAICANALQVGIVLGICVLMVLQPALLPASPLVRQLLLAAVVVVGGGAVLDIRDAIASRKMLRQMDTMGETVDAMGEINNRLRAQRHDFLNHLQVVYSLMEMKEYDEATRYIDRVYGDVTALGQTLKTANAAVNALLQVKLAACEKAGIQVKLDITSDWKSLAMPAWEMCKVLANLIDNAMDAAREAAKPELRIALAEDVKHHLFRIGNNGAAIPEAMRQTIFLPGVTTKSEGHGMGLSIVREVMENSGAELRVISDDGWTSFEGSVPKAKADAKTEDAAI